MLTKVCSLFGTKVVPVTTTEDLSDSKNNNVGEKLVVEALEPLGSPLLSVGCCFRRKSKRNAVVPDPIEALPLPPTTPHRWDTSHSHYSVHTSILVQISLYKLFL